MLASSQQAHAAAHQASAWLPLGIILPAFRRVLRKFYS